MNHLYYNLNGIPSETPPESAFWIQENAVEFVLKENDLTYEINTSCIQLTDHLATKIFGTLADYHTLLPQIPAVYYSGGIDPEVNISKEDFEKFSNLNDETHNKLLYFYDVANIIGTLQNSVIESKYLLGQFYKSLNTNSFLIDESAFMVDEGFQYAAGPIVTNITSTTNHIFINLYSQLDFITKVVYEFEHLQTDFATYPRIKSKDILFGDNKRTKLTGLPGSIYEPADSINRIISLRNEIVHNSSIDSIPKVYQVIKNKKIVEKFILIPDFQNGYIKSFKNRKRFFSQDLKLNELLPSIIFEFWQKIKVTLDAIT